MAGVALVACAIAAVGTALGSLVAGQPGRAPHVDARRAARRLRGRCRRPRHRRAHAVGGCRRPRRGPAPRRPPRCRSAPAAADAHRAGGRRGARPGRRRHPRGRHACCGRAPGRRSAPSSRPGPLWIVAGTTWWPAFFLFPLAGVAALAAVRPLLPRALGPQGRGGGRLDRPRRRHGGGRGRARRPPGQPRPGLRRTPLHRARRRDPPPVRDRPRARGPDRPTHRHAAARRPRRHRPGRRHAGRRPSPRHRVAGDAVHRHDDVRRPGRHAGATPARPAGRLRRRAPPAWAPRRGARAVRWRRPSRRAAGRAVPQPALRLRRGPLRPPVRRPRRPGRHHLRPGGAHRLRQVDPGVAVVAGRRPRARLGPDRRRRRARRRPPGPALGGRRGHPAHRDPRRHPRREHHALRAGAARRRRERGRRARASTPGWPGSPKDWTPCSARAAPACRPGEEQLVAFARLLVRDVRVVVLDEATARMDPVTETHVVRAAERLLSGRTGLLVAHRLSTTERAEQVAVLDGGRVVQQGPRARLAGQPGPFRSLLEAASDEDAPAAATVGPDTVQVGTARRSGQPPASPRLREIPSLTRATASALFIEPKWGLISVGLFLLAALSGAFGAITGWIWGHLVVALQDGQTPVAYTTALVVSLHGLAAAAGRVVPPLPAMVDLGDAPGPVGGADRPDRAAPSRADAARRGRRPLHGRRPAGPLRRPLGRLRQRARHRSGHRDRRAEPAGRRRAARRDGGLRARLVPGSAGGRAVRRGVRRRPGQVRPLAGLDPRLRAHGQAGGVDAERARTPAARSTPGGSTPRSASTACRRCSTAYPS